MVTVRISRSVLLNRCCILPYPLEWGIALRTTRCGQLELQLSRASKGSTLTSSQCSVVKVLLLLLFGPSNISYSTTTNPSFDFRAYQP